VSARSQIDGQTVDFVAHAQSVLDSFKHRDRSRGGGDEEVSHIKRS